MLSNYNFKKPKNDSKRDVNTIPNKEAYKFCKTLVKNFNFALDIGGHLGESARMFSSDFKKVYTFEPMFFEYTIHNTKDLDNVTVHPVGLGNIIGEEQLYLMTENTGGSSIILHKNRKWQEKAKSYPIQIRTLDSFNIEEEIDFIKIDTESYEYFVIDGARETLTKHSPVLMVEFLKNYQHQIYNLDKVQELIISLGYKKINHIKNDNIYIKE